MINESPRRGLKAAGAEADQFEQFQPTASPTSFQLIARAVAETSEAGEPRVAALAYARAGLRVFPCDPQDKKPLVAHGFKAASTDPKQINAWWTRSPDAMIGMPTGRTNGMFVLDVDVDTKQNIDGFIALAAFEKQHGNLPETLRSTTPRGGSHYFFRWHKGIKNSASRLGPGLDTRGDGGYCILPPSRRSDGHAYEWKELSAAEPCDPPAWLVDFVIDRKEKPTPQAGTSGNGNAAAYGRAALERECAAVAAAQPGKRNETLNRAAFSLFQLAAGGVLSEGEVCDRLFSAAVACGQVRDDGEAAVRATIESGRKAGHANPRTRPEGHQSHGDGTDKTSDMPLTFCNIGVWATREPPPREWAVPDRFPLRNVALLSGEGAVGKSILLMQLATAHVIAKDWVGTLPEPGPVLYFNAEDEEAELHRRLAAIATHYGVGLSDLKNDLHVLSLAGREAVLGYPDRAGLIKPTPLFAQMKEAAFDIRPKLIGLDTSADIFAGNENDRTQVRQFIGLMRSMAIGANAAVIIAAHPSLTGINSGTGLSGNTAWHNSVRSRAYMRAVKTENGIEPDQNLRQLEFMKSNYGPIAETVTLRWRNGVFVTEPKAGSLEKLAAEATADEMFLRLLDRYTREGRTVGDKRGHSYAPAQFAKEAEAKAAGLRSEALADAMRRLFATKKIQVEAYGRPSNPHHRIAAGPPQ
jgi:RecA-family ATPase